MNIARQIALGTLAAGVAACGYPDFSYGSGSSGSSGSSGTFVSSGTGGTSGTNETSGMSGTSGDDRTCPVAHPGGGTCEYTPGAVCGCSDGDKCSVVDTSGSSACTRAGSTPAYAKCSTDSDCVAGTFCEPSTGACATICRNVDDCVKGAQCIPARSTNGTGISGLKICTAHCEPVSAKPCGSNLACFYRDEIADFVCTSSLRIKEDQPCQSDSACDRGLLCLSTDSGSTGTCQPWCSPVKSTTGNGCPKAKPRCIEIAVAVEYNGVEYGFCSK